MTRYWFKPKSYGYGATPVTWEGWAVTLAAVIVVAGSVVAMNRLVAQSNAVAWLTWAALIAAGTWWFVQFCRRRTDGEWRWRRSWSNRSDATGI
jgi:hypothetical protein